MYIGHARLSLPLSFSLYVCKCASVCLSLAAFPHYCTDPDVTWGNDKGAP